MKILVGLGNPGEKYQNNRHNVGFQFIDYFVRTEQCSIPTYNKYLISEITECQLNNGNIILAKPQTFMNKSGPAVQKLTINYKLQPTSLIIVHDDLDIPLGKYRIDFAKGPKLHNGLTSVEQALKTKNFWRVRIGVDNRQGIPIPGETYVLQDFKEEERETVNILFLDVFKRLKDILFNTA